MPTASGIADAQLFYDTFCSALAADGQTIDVWNRNWDTATWTELATSAADKAAAAVLWARGHALSTAAKGSPDEFGRNEYLTLDVTAYGPTAWGAPVVAVELESTASKARYCAWKLLSVDAELRALITFVDRTGGGDPYPTDIEALARKLQPVLADQPGKPLVLIATQWQADPARPGGTGWADVFDMVVLRAGS